MNRNLNEDQFDALHEIANIAMGKAGAALAKILDRFVRLSVPNVIIIDVDNISKIIPNMVENIQQVNIVRQAFYDQLDGEAFVIYSDEGCQDLEELMGYKQYHEKNLNQELLLDITNILVGATLNSFADQISSELSYSRPTLFEEKTFLEPFFTSHSFPWKSTLLFKVAFTLEEGSFTSHILIFLSEQSIERIEQGINTWLEAI